MVPELTFGCYFCTVVEYENRLECFKDNSPRNPLWNLLGSSSGSNESPLSQAGAGGKALGKASRDQEEARVSGKLLKLEFTG